MEGEVFSISEALRFGWETFKRNLGPSLALVAGGIAAGLVLNGLTEASARYTGLAMGFTLIAQLVQILWAFIWIRFALTVYDGRPFELRELVPDGRTFLNYLAVSILYGLMVTVGLLLLIVPGVYLAVRYAFAGFLVADRRTEVLDSFHESSELTRGVRGRLFLLMLVLFLLNLAGALLFGVGLLFTVPLSAFAMTLVYRRLLVRNESQYYVGPVVAVPVMPT
jgi:uncharacterized membrane protein